MAINKNFPNYSKAPIVSKIVKPAGQGLNRHDRRRNVALARRWPVVAMRMNLKDERDRLTQARGARIRARQQATHERAVARKEALKNNG